METPKIFWATNIKFLRNRKQLSQDSMAESLGISRSKLNAHENGHTVNPPVEDLVRLSEYFRISIDSLLRVDLSRLGPFKLKELEAGNDVYMTGSKIRVLAITVDQENREQVEYVPVKAKAGYAAGCSDPDFIAGLPRFNLPNLPRHGSFRIFPISGDSMLPIPSGSDIVARFEQDWTQIKEGTLCILVLSGQQDIVFKKLERSQEEGHFRLISLNPAYAPYTVSAADITEIWSFYQFHTATLPEPATDLQQVMQALQSLQQEVRKLKQ